MWFDLRLGTKDLVQLSGPGGFDVPIETLGWFECRLGVVQVLRCKCLFPLIHLCWCPGANSIKPRRKLYSLGREGTRKIETRGPLLSEEAMKVHAASGCWRGCPATETAPPAKRQKS